MTTQQHPPSEARVRFETALEREIHKYFRLIAEHTYDFTHLYTRRNQVPVEPHALEAVLEVVKLAMSDGELSKMPMFHEGLQKALDAFVEDVSAYPMVEQGLPPQANEAQPPPLRTQQQQGPRMVKVNFGGG